MYHSIMSILPVNPSRQKCIKLTTAQPIHLFLLQLIKASHMNPLTSRFINSSLYHSTERTACRQLVIHFSSYHTFSSLGTVHASTHVLFSPSGHYPSNTLYVNTHEQFGHYANTSNHQLSLHQLIKSLSYQSINPSSSRLAYV